VRAAIVTDPKTKEINVEATAQAGHVTQKGVVFSTAMLESASGVTKGLRGVTNVSCEAAEIPRDYPGPIMQRRTVRLFECSVVRLSLKSPNSPTADLPNASDG
jgi:hypothetical protein